MDVIGQHLAYCSECLQLFRNVFQERRTYAPAVIDLSSEKWLRDEHLDYEWLVAYVGGEIEQDGREMTELHLRLCRQCREEAEDFAAWQRESEPELKIRYVSSEQVSLFERIGKWWTWQTISRKPAYAVAALLVVGIGITLAILFLAPGQDGHKNQQVRVSPSPSILVTTTPALSNFPSPSPMPQLKVAPETRPTQNDRTAKASNTLIPSTKSTIRLKDGNRIITIDESGQVTGLGSLPPETAMSVRDFLGAEEIGRPAVLAELTGDKSALRGEGIQSSFKLLSPVGLVILDDHPVFRWERLSGASSYRVYVSDSRSRKIADSGVLSPIETQWSLPIPLKRDEIYSWVVGGMVNGEEIVSPSVSEPEAKFRLLSEQKANALNLLERKTDSHLVLGVFYAQAGMLAEAEREVQQLTNNNPGSAFARRLLQVIQSWR